VLRPYRFLFSRQTSQKQHFQSFKKKKGYIKVTSFSVGKIDFSIFFSVDGAYGNCWISG